jgi:hypothetical protein
VALSNGCPVSGPVLAVGTHTINAGRSSVSFPAVADAWRDVRVRMRYPATGTATVTTCSTDNFAIKPSYLSVVASDADWQTAGTTRTLNAVTSSGTPTHKAGQPFTLRVTGYNASNVVTANYTADYTASPSVSVACVLPASGCILGTLSTGTFSSSSGSDTFTSDTASYSEVGAITATLTDTSFASVDSADTAASCAGYYTCSSATAVGRFIPDHFAVSPGVVTTRVGRSCNPASDFTYFGEDFSTAFTLTAENSASTPTQNYTGTLAKLGLTSWAGLGFSGVDAGNAVPLLAGASAPSGSWSSGTASVTATHTATRAQSGTPNAEASVTVKTLPVDSDGVTLSDATKVNGSPALLRFGRLRIANATGSEFLVLPISLTAQYWKDSGFIINKADACTALAAPTLTYFTPPTTPNNQLESGETTATYNNPFVEGRGGLVLTKPCTGTPCKGNYGFVDVTVTAPAWLQYNWDGVDQGSDGNLFDDNPRARATFGKRKGADKVIIRREIY